MSLEISELEAILNKYEEIIYDKENQTIRINFVVRGYKTIKNLVLQKNGIFAFYLYDQEMRKRDVILG